MAENQQEIEWQFDVQDLGRVEAWLRVRAAAGDLQFHFGVPEEQADSYYDTADWRFFRANYALRVRQLTDARNEATLKSFGTQKDGLRQRHEINEPLNAHARTRDPAKALAVATGLVGVRVRAVLGKHPLRRLFDARTQRRRVVVRREGARLAEIALDNLSIAADRRRAPVRIHRVEVELLHEGMTEIDSRPSFDVAAAFVKEMREACNLRPATTSKFELGLHAQNLQPAFAVDLGQPDDAEHLGDQPTIEELAFAVMRGHFAQFLSREPGVRLGEEAEEVHRMRVATRRLRAAMSLFRDYLPPEAQRLRGELGWVARLLGGVRDLDVQLERLETWRTGEEALEPTALRNLEGLLNHQREQARSKLLDGLNSARYDRFVADYIELLLAGSSDASADVAANPARHEMPRLILRRYVKMREDGDAIDDDAPPTDYHELRIQCKRLRYALEFASTLYPKATRAFLPRLVELQDLLGAHQDAYVAIEEMRDLSLVRQPELPTQTIFMLGELSQRYAHQAEELREQFPKAYRRIKGKAWQQVQRALDDM